MMSSAYKIKKLRESRKYSQEYVAEALGISQNAYSKIENEQTKLTTERLSKLAEILEVPEYELLESGTNFILQHNNITYAYVHQLFDNQKEVYEKMIDILKEQLSHAQDEIKRLQNIVQTKVLK
jgi:transcriptional regulator with XRE-family HTH domain